MCDIQGFQTVFDDKELTLQIEEIPKSETIEPAENAWTSIFVADHKTRQATVSSYVAHLGASVLASQDSGNDDNGDHN